MGQRRYSYTVAGHQAGPARWRMKGLEAPLAVAAAAALDVVPAQAGVSGVSHGGEGFGQEASR